MIKIITDSTSDISPSEGVAQNIEVVPLTVLIDGTTYTDGVDLTPEEFYPILEKAKTFPKTSQPAPNEFIKHFQKAKDDGDQVICITISSKLSGTYQSALIAKDTVDYQSIYIIDSLNTVACLRMLVIYAVKLREQALDAETIAQKVTALRSRIHVYSIADTLTYLHKGGRLPKTVAIIGNLLRVKPLITIIDGELKLYGKAIGSTRGYEAIINKIKTYPIDFDFPVYFIYTKQKNNLDKLISYLSSRVEIKNDGEFNLGSVIGSHYGPNGVAIIYVTKENLKM